MLKLTFPDLFSFYNELNNIENTSNLSYVKSLEDDNNCMAEFNMTYSEISKYKYSYTKGLDKLKQLNLDWEIGSRRKKYHWSEVDGDDMSIERFNDDLPFMQQRINKQGNNNGKFIDITINMDIIAGVSSRSLSYRSYMVTQICDYLEENGYKVSITVYDSYSHPGTFRGKSIDTLLIEVVLKNYDEPLNKGMLLTATSPWMLRLYFFKFVYIKFSNSILRCGRVTKGGITKSSVDIGYEGMEESSAKEFIERVKKELLEEKEEN